MSSTTPPTKPRKVSRATRTLLRRASSMSDGDRFGIGGKLKSRHAPRAISLPTVMCLQRPADDQPIEHNHRDGLSSADRIAGRER